MTIIEIPDPVTSIGTDAFSGTKWLENKQAENPLVIVNGILIDGKTCTGGVVIPDTVTSVGNCAFSECSSLTSIEIPNSVTSIGEYAFNGCSRLTSIEIPNSVTSIGRGAFYYCYGLTDVYYTGTSDDWNKIDIGKENDKLTSSKIHFGTSRKDELTEPTTTTTTTTTIIATTTTTTTTNKTSTEKTSLGDLNKDDKIDSKDAVLILKSYAEELASGKKTVSADFGDVNSDGKVDSKDAVWVLKYYAETLTGYMGIILDFIKK